MISQAQTLVIVFLMITITERLNAEEWKSENKVNLVFGLTQPIFAKGINIEGNYIHKRLIVNYSHGSSLDFSENLVNADLREQDISVHIPYTTGFGIGYRFEEWINIRVEPKWHRFEFYYDGDSQDNSNIITSYNTMSLGIGVYGHYQPFKNQKSFLHGIMLAPSVRFWPTISSTLEGDRFTYSNKVTGTNEEIKTLDSGVSFTPFIINISIGYSFDL
jgi:hypothetical protein